ncbi:hypothetical protein [Nonomuraea rubra]|uniref:Uncharacterized protein n=1 Tax=Nonomuraea rubra TaxID=46180 RepID=A0A7X0U411_9ACTN|nr:hypothetical protein [Nonomuraea rubra]MBB6554492.1 hypothetical protein [Nonomuraea rubra]
MDDWRNMYNWVEPTAWGCAKCSKAGVVGMHDLHGMQGERLMDGVNVSDVERVNSV